MHKAQETKTISAKTERSEKQSELPPEGQPRGEQSHQTFLGPSASADFNKLICISGMSKFLFLIISHNNRRLFINALSDKRLLRLSISIKCIAQTTCLPELAMVGVDSTGKAVLKYRQCSRMSWYLKVHLIPFYVQGKFPGSLVSNQ